MEFSLDHDEERQRETMITELEGAGVGLTAAVETFNAQMKAAWAKVEEAQNLYNEKVRTAQTFVSTVHTKYSAIFDEQPEDWQDSDVAEPVTEWLSEWGTMLDESDVEMPEPVEIILAHEDLDNLPNKPDCPNKPD